MYTLYMHIVYFIVSKQTLDRTELKPSLLLMLNKKNNKKKTVSSNSATTSADGPILPVCSHSACDDRARISPLSTPEIEVHKGGEVCEGANMGDLGHVLGKLTKFITHVFLSVLAFHPHWATIIHTQ